MALPRPQWVVVGPSADERYKLCDALALRYGIVHVAESVASSSADESNGADVVLRRLHNTDCATQGWVLNSVPSTIEECNAFIAGGIVPRIVFDFFEDDASSTLRSLVDAALQVWKSASDTTTTIKCAISSPDSSETVATSIYRAIDTRTWTLHLQSEVPSLADEHPEAVADLVHVTATLPLTEQAAAMKLLSSLLTFKGMGALAPDCGSSVVSLVKVYTGVSKATQATVASRFPPEILAMLPFVETLSPNALMTMAPLAQEIFIDASSAGAIQPATAVKVHTAFFEVLSEKERRQLVRMLPAKEQELVTHVVETTEGLSPRGVETVVHMLLQSTNHSLPSQPSKNHSPPQPFVVPGPNETSVHQPLADHTYGAIDIPDAPPPPSRDAVMAKLALTATKAHGRRLMRWVRSAPRSLRVLSFVSSVLLFVTACISMVLDVVAGPMIVVVINMWIVVFSLIMVSVEVKITAIEKHNSIATYFPLVRTVTGRGAFLLFISLIAMTLAVKATWQNAVLGVAGVVAAGISLWSIALGSIASHQFNALRSRIESLAQLKQAFDLADVDRAGELDVDGLGRFCLVWDWPIDVYFLEAIVRDLDGHNSNAVSLSDLQVWWSRAHHDTTMPPLQQSPRLSRCHRPTSIVKLFSVFTGVLTMVTGLVGNIASFHPRCVRCLWPLHG
ncbi:hypothetical protein, variant [Aphanomyces invadans]|uniref:EF-hand domain-containing protein n=1 Tax=Aphanomyces invadans TaxID=157072 RepID=A0A024UJL7_9STRA|nr:hypothetical protein, variant [Aphanomyces invadans]ETW06052.1 hypothetical protein, variant [Aphanomyces invadans]|eukprot:XP_008865829.1 hypothetical protein, variant [Aphanomyces invadans]